MPSAVRATKRSGRRTLFKSVNRSWIMSVQTDIEQDPQGLKPVRLSVSGGMAEAVPFPKPAAAAALFPNSSDGLAATDGATGIDRATNIREVVKQKYGEAALRVKSG